MNNKSLGTMFEKYVCADLAHKGYWVHFVTPDKRGAQPFDIIAVKDGMAMAIECKTMVDNKHYFPFTRLEENQIFACEKWIRCGNESPLIAVQWKGRCSYIPYTVLKEEGKVDLNDVQSYCR